MNVHAMTTMTCLFHFRSLNCDRLRVHKNFMMALIIRYVVSVIYYEPYIYGDPDRIIWFRDIGQVSACKY